MEDDQPYASSSMSFPVLQQYDLERVAEIILHLFDPSTSSNPAQAKQLQQELQQIQTSTEAWGLIAGLATYEDPNVRFFSAHTAQVKISRDWDSLPRELQPALLALLLSTLGHAISPTNPLSYQPANAVVVRKLFGCLASLLLRLPFHLFPSPLITVLNTISSAASAAALPPSLPSSGFNTPTPVSGDEARVGWKMRLWALEWLAICVEEIGRAGISEQKRIALRRHLDVDLPQVMETIKGSMQLPDGLRDLGGMEERLKEAEAACKCAESWISYGLGGDELIALLPSLYSLLPLPAASSAIAEALSESLFKFGKGTKVLTEPLIAWSVGTAGQAVIGSADGEPSEEVIAFAKLLCALVDHSSEWLVSRIKQVDVQNFLGLILRLTGWEGTGGVDENVSELTLSIYPLLQEAIMDSEVFSAPHETSEEWGIAKNFFKELVNVIRRKVRWLGDGEGSQSLGGMDKEDREAFETWRRDAGEVIVGAYYILREEMLRDLVQQLVGAVQSDTPWQDIESILHCIRYSSEAVPLGEDQNLPTLFGEAVLGRLAQRPQTGKGEERLRLTAVCVIQSYEEWFKFHPDHLLPVLSYLVPSLTLASSISRYAADALKALCDICRTKLVDHIGAFAELHDKIGNLGPEEQTKVIQAITSVIQALSPINAIGPVEGILNPIVERLSQAVLASGTSPLGVRPLLVQTMNALTAAFKGLAPSDDDIFDLTDDETSQEKDAEMKAARSDSRMISLRGNIKLVIGRVVEVWDGDGEVADALSSLVKHSTLASSDTLISLSPLPLLTLVTTAAERSSSALWMSLASTLVLRINTPPSALAKQQSRTAEGEQAHQQGEVERWNIVGDAAARLVVVAGRTLGGAEAMRDNPDIVEAWFKFCSAMSSRFPGVLLRLPSDLVEGYFSLGVMGLATQERFSLKTTCDFFIALLATTRFPSPLEPLADTLLKHFGQQLLRAIILSAGSEGPRSVIPNLAELLAGFVQRIPGDQMNAWMTAVLGEEGFPDPKATIAAKTRLKEVVLRSRTTKKMREALHEFALVARGLDNTTYGNATAV